MHHTLGWDAEIEVRLDSSSAEPGAIGATLVGRDPTTDLALLQAAKEHFPVALPAARVDEETSAVAC